MADYNYNSDFEDIPMPGQSDQSADDSIPLVDNTPGTSLTPAPNPEDLKTRAAKYDFALGSQSPGQDALISRMQSNMEDADRQKYAINKTLQLHNIRNEMVRGLADQASGEGRTFTQAETDAALSLSNLAISDLQEQSKINEAQGNVPGTIVQSPTTIFEREYADKVIQNSIDTGEDTPFNNAYTADPEGVHTKLDVFSDLTTYKEAYQKLAEEIDAKVAQQSTIGYAADFLKGFIPGYTYFKSRNLLKNEPSLLPGNNMLDTVHTAYTGRPEQTIPQVRDMLHKLAADNPQLAAITAHALLDYPSSARLLDNILITGGDLATIIPAGTFTKGLPKLSELALTGIKKVPDVVNRGAFSAAVTTVKDAVTHPAYTFNHVLSSVASTVMRKDATIPEVLDSAGQVNASAATSVIDKVVNQYSNVAADATKARDLINELPGIFNAMEVTGGIRSTWATKMTSETMQDLLSDAQNGIKRLFLDNIKANKYGPEAIKAATIAARDTFKIERRDLENSIMNVFENNLDEGLGDHQVVIHLGQDDATPFVTAAQADIVAELRGLMDTGYKAVPAGNGWAIQIQRPADFTLDSVRDAMKIDAKNNPTPWSNVLGRVLTNIRSGDDVLPSSVVEKLKRVTYGSSGLQRLITQSAKRVGKLRGDSAKNFQSFIKSESLERNPLNPDKPGMMSRNPQEFELKWSSRFNRLPTDGEKNAYFTYRFINDMHYAGLNLGLYLDKNAAGLVDLTIPGIDAKVEGKITTLDSLNKLDKDVNAHIMVLEPDQDPWFAWSKFSTIKRKDQEISDYERMKKLVEEKGYVLTRVSDTGDDAIRGAMNKDLLQDGRIHYVLTPEVKAEPLSLRQINYQPGIHNIMPDGWYISQPRMFHDPKAGTATYYGDRNIFFAGNEKIGKDFAGRMETFRKALEEARSIKKSVDPIAREAALKAAQAYAKSHLPISFRQLVKDFGKNGRLDLHTPILARASNQSLNDAHKLADHFPNTRFIKHSESELNLYRGHVNLEFATERGDPIREIVNKGDPAAPIYGMRQADLMDPMAALDRGVSAMIRGRYFEPLKVEIGNQFVSEFGDLVEDSSKSLLADPFRTIADFKNIAKKNIQGEDIERMRQARAYAARANQFFGNVNNQETKFYKYLGQKLIGTENPEAASAWRKSLAQILNEKDPADIFKQLAFHPKMGFFNPKQLLQQGNTFINVVALSPKYGVKAGVYSMIMRASMIDPKLMEQGAKIAERLGFDSKEFIEIATAMDRSGFAKMGLEYATRQQHLEAKVVQTKLGAMLDHGLFFMREGEEFVRRAAFAAAYMEKKAANGLRKVTDNDIQAITNRADFYNVNMSHASNAAWQQGFTSIPTQFWSYQIRLMEQLWGKRMTNAERARLIGAYSIFYGIPIGAATTLMPLWPVHESIKEHLIANHIDTDDHLITKVLNDGIASNLMQMITGEDTNIENIYGPSGVPLLKDLMDGNKTYADAIFGASGNVLFNTLSAISPAIGWIGSSIMGYERPPLKAQDFVDVLNSISSLSTLEKMYIALTTQKYLTRYGQTIGTGDSVAHMLFNSLLGVQPQPIDDMYRMMQVNENYDNYTKKLNRWIQEDVRNGLNATSDADRESWFKRVEVKSKWFPSELDSSRAIVHVLTENKDLIQRAQEMFARQSPEAADYIAHIQERDNGVK